MLIDFRQLFPKYNIKPKGVLHVGANVGEEAPVYLELGIEQQVWIEANPDIHAKLKDNISGNKRAVAILQCVGENNNEKVIFHISNNAGQSSSVLDLGTHLIVHPEVKYIQDIEILSHRLDSVLNMLNLAYMMKKGNDRDEIYSLDFLNIDLQGAELKALKGMGKYLNQFKWAYLEVNKEELYKGCALVGEIDEYLAGFGFKRVETLWAGNTGWGDALYIK